MHRTDENNLDAASLSGELLCFSWAVGMVASQFCAKPEVREGRNAGEDGSFSMVDNVCAGAALLFSDRSLVA